MMDVECFAVDCISNDSPSGCRGHCKRKKIGINGNNLKCIDYRREL